MPLAGAIDVAIMREHLDVAQALVAQQEADEGLEPARQDDEADAVITATENGGSEVTWDELTIVLDVVVTQDDFINPITD